MTLGPVSFTPLDLAREIVRLGEEDPCYAYRPPEGGGGGSCSYVDSANRPGSGCIVGQALEGLGVDRSDLREWESERASGGDDLGVFALADSLWPEGGYEPHLYPIGRAQAEQDTGSPWIVAVTPLRVYLDMEGLLDPEP